MKISIITRLLFLTIWISLSGIVGGQETEFSFSTTTELINIQSLIKITYNIHPDITASRYNLLAADYAFQEFERNLSQFTPLTFKSGLKRKESVGIDATDIDYSYYNEVGMNKEFFNGASISAYLGYKDDWGGSTEEGSNFYSNLDLTYPLFGSYKTLDRITQRSYQESELFNNRLGYVDSIRFNIQASQVSYVWLEVEIENLELTQSCLKDYQTILESDRIKKKLEEKKQVEDELKSLQSQLTRVEGNIKSNRIYLQSGIGFENLNPEQIERMNLYSPDYYGKNYMNGYEEELLKEAEDNDVSIKVLTNALKNSEQKRLLAQKGKWDVNLNISAEGNWEGYGSRDKNSDYSIFSGLEIKKIDPKLLSINYKKADAEIKKYQAQIRNQRLNIRNQVRNKWTQAWSLRTQADELVASRKSRQEVFQQKLKDYIEGKESVDNLIQSRKNLNDTEMNLTGVLGEFYETITQLDMDCNVYFKVLKLENMF